MSTPTLPTGYDPYERFFATRFRQGGRTVYSLDFSVRELITFLPKPDADKPVGPHSAQRRIIPKHAHDFSTYMLTRTDWISPALLLRSPEIFKFEIYDKIDTGTTQFGILAVPKDAKSEMKLLDGQHRTLGFHFTWEALAQRIENARADVAAAKASSDQPVLDHHQARLDELLAQREMLSNERVSVQIVIVDTPDVARRIFVDINDNAKGITGAVRERFNDQTAVGPALNKLIDGKSELLNGRVDLEQDRVLGSSPYLLSAKHVADILRALAVGNGRIGKVVAQSLDENQLIKDFEAFEEALLNAFPALAEVVDGDFAPADLRQSHLIGSNVVMRAFAAAWHDLHEGGWTPDKITTEWGKFDGHMGLPIYAQTDDSWYKLGVVDARLDGAYSTRSAAQNFKTLTAFIVGQTKAGSSAKWHRATASDPNLIA